MERQGPLALQLQIQNEFSVFSPETARWLNYIGLNYIEKKTRPAAGRDIVRVYLSRCRHRKQIVRYPVRLRKSCFLKVVSSRSMD